MGRRFVEPPPFDLKSSYYDSSTISPLIFVLSTGSDPNKDLLLLAQELGMSDKLKSIALGQGQGTSILICVWFALLWQFMPLPLFLSTYPPTYLGKLAARMVENGVIKGDWVLLQNCHLSLSWMPELEKIVEDFEPEKIHKNFRLWWV